MIFHRYRLLYLLQIPLSLKDRPHSAVQSVNCIVDANLTRSRV